MNKRLIILIAILLVLMIGVGLWWRLSQSTDDESAAAPIDPSQIFPVPPSIVASSSTPPNVLDGSPTPIIPPAAPATNQPNPNLVSLSTRAVTGVTVIKSATSTESDRVLFLERETGLIIEMNLGDREKRELARLPIRAPINEAVLNLEISKGKTAKLSVWFSTASGDEQNFFRSSLDLNSASSTNPDLPEMSPEPMGANTKSFALSPARDQLFTLEQIGEETIGKIFDAKNLKGRLVFESKINQWLTTWPEKNSIILTSKPASRAGGYLYLLNPRGNLNNQKKIIGGLNGLTVLISPNGQKALYARSAFPNLELGLYDRQKNETRVLAIATLPQKCVWTADSSAIYCAVPRAWPTATYPDDYLAGEVAVDDLLWRIETKDGIGRLVWSDEPGLGDAVNLLTANQNQKIIFTDRLTGRLYLIVDQLIP